MFRGESMRKYKISLLSMSAVLLVSQVAYASSKDLEVKKQQMTEKRDEVSQEIKEKKGNVDETQSKVSAVQREIDALDNQIVGVTGEISNLEDEISVLNTRIEKNKKELEEAERNLEEKKEIFGQRVKAMYMDGKVSYMEVLLNSKDVEELIRNNQTITTIAESDKQLVDFITDQVNVIKDAKKQLEEDKAEVERNRSELEVQKQSLLDKNNKKSEYMQALEKDVELYLIEYEKTEASWNAIDKEIIRLQSQIKTAKADEARAERERIEREKQRNQAKNSSRTSPDYIKPTISDGSMAWPLPGHTHISSPYGNRFHPVLGRSKFHSGIDLPAPIGTPVIAAKSGTVIMSTSMGGYGNVVMIDHGDIVTVYAHNSVLKARVGQNVKQGDVVSLVGNTGLSTGPHLHFEVRVNGATQNPLNYV